jgi:acetyl esterase/lipase
LSSAPQKLDHQIADYLAAAPEWFAPVITEQTYQVVREQRARAPRAPLSPDVERIDFAIPGDQPVSVRVHRERTSELRSQPCVYLLHGGGYIGGSQDFQDWRFDRWCKDFGCIGVTIEYRLAPEAPYPAAIEDCYAGLAWIHRNSEQLGIDATRIGIFGQSAGGGLGAALSLMARDRGEYQLEFQALMYPMLDDRQFTASSQWDDVPVWPPASNAFGWRSYLGELYGTDQVPAYAAPARATDLGGLPRTYIMVGSLDLFHDEDVEFARRLSHAGVPTELHVYPGAPHGFDAPNCSAELSVRARREVDEWLAARLLVANDSS